LGRFALELGFQIDHTPTVARRISMSQPSSAPLARPVASGDRFIPRLKERVVADFLYNIII
jgi:hypothetical protein